MLLDLQLDARPDRAAATRGRAGRPRAPPGCSPSRARTTCSCPLAATAGHVDADLMTNVAIAMPRSPMHLAHAAWDLQLMSGGRFRLGLGSQVRPHIENRYGATWSPPAARMREIVLAVKAILASWQDGTPPRLPRRAHPAHADAADVRPRTEPLRPATGAARRARSGDDRTAAEVADGLLVMPFHSHRHFRERTLPAVEEGLRRSGRDRIDVYPQAILAMGRTEEERGCGDRGSRDAAGVLRLHAGVPAGAGGRGLGRPPAGAQHASRSRATSRRCGHW